jgi:chaperonin cofactor prefoldin
MKKFVIIIALGFSLYANENLATKDDIKLIIEQMDKRFEQVDKRFEQIDRRFEQTDKRIDFMQNILYLVLGASIGSPFVAEYLSRRKDKEFQEEHERVSKIIFALKNIAKDDPKIKESLQIAGIL